jgi:hypothetical protein
MTVRLSFWLIVNSLVVGCSSASKVPYRLAVKNETGKEIYHVDVTFQGIQEWGRVPNGQISVKQKEFRVRPPSEVWISWEMTDGRRGRTPRAINLDSLVPDPGGATICFVLRSDAKSVDVILMPEGGSEAAKPKK